ncbi:phenylalanyl-tRNA synthetase [Pseudomassariella vexata]|uniref:Phenylalanine--tRNA ligase beta subunit n=1 Tax=Pseudomassariella vexata TaxID=1141098 RepID=A0A1Y2DWA0_9PEZI|nr:phenylalanyl-tRNA synthetase [Pseudomassariella vexata]ORY63548.1 phenylalanyl-tRNA synthetase [Pseudomassariella vexata]
MPTISVDKYDLFEALGQKYTTEEFEELCFEFGIELDEDTENEDRPIVNGQQEPPTLKIEIPANRYDMLCFEGIALMLNIFRGKTPTPNFRLTTPASGELHTITVREDTMKVRPLVAGAILRNVKFTQKTYDSFIALQDKLHQNLARQRTLVAIGTHDLDTVKGPFTYEALPPKEIEFIPLNQTKKMNAEEMMQFYEKESKHLAKFLPIIKDKPVYPVIYDANRVVCSMPPIINGDHSKITLDSKNVLIECTATDATKLEIVINMMVTMFSVYSEEQFTVEPVKVLSDHNGQTRITPNLSPRIEKVEVDYLNNCLGLQESPETICELLFKMALSAKPSSDKNIIEISIPPTRADILQRCDIMEDVGIAYGFNKLPRMSVNKTVGAPLTLNKLGDIVRLECGMAGWSEVMPLILCSHDENFAWLRRHDDGKTAVRLANPKTQEYQIVRTSLLPGLLKTIRENKSHSVPIKVFETSDVVFKDESLERKARNERHFSAAWYGRSSGFEEVHGLLDRVMLMLRQAFLTREEGIKSGGSIDFKVVENHQKRDGYWLEPIDTDKEQTFFPGRAAAIYLSIGGKAARIGEFGILHPEVLEKFDLKYPVSTLEVNLEVFL